MKTYQTFEELVIAFEHEEIPFCIVQEITMALGDVCKNSEDITLDDVKTIRKQLAGSPTRGEFIFEMGGNVLVCETEEDLKRIVIFDLEWTETHPTMWATAMEVVGGLDICQYLQNDPELGWALMVAIWNNAGGSSFFVPENLWAAAKLEENLQC